MHHFRTLLKTFLLTSCMTTALFSTAQLHTFLFHPVKNTVFTSHDFIGEVNSRFFLMHHKAVDGLDLLIYDTAAQTGISHSYPFTGQLVSVLLHERSIAFIGFARDSAGINYHFLEVDEDGTILHKNEFTQPVFNVPLRVITSADQKHTLLYQFAKKSIDSLVVRGSMVGADGQIEKQIFQSVKYDSERDREPETFLDNNGNMHILVFDKYNNYRISTNLTLNTISFTGEETTGETFVLEKVKLKTMHVFQNDHCNCMEVEGMYTDAMKKTVDGLYSIAVTLGKKKEVTPVFFPFDDAMIRAAKKGYSFSDKLARNNLLLENIVYSDSGSFAMMRLNPAIPDPRNPVTTFINPFSPLVTRSNKWNAPKLIFLKLGKEETIEWQLIKPLDVFRSFGNIKDMQYRLPANIYNNIYLVGGEKNEIGAILYESDAQEEPNPVFISVKDGKQTVEKIPEKKLVFSPIRFLAPGKYVSFYLDTETGVNGLMFIQKKE